MSKPQARHRSEFKVFAPITTRWMDNDVYGHVNNVTYYSYFDTAVNGYLVEQGVLDMHDGAVIGLVVETGCQYFSPIAFPDAIEAGFKVAKMGNSSRSEERGVGKAGVRTCRSRGWPDHYKKKRKKANR